MRTRCPSYALIAMLMSAVALVPWCVAALPVTDGLEHIPVQGSIASRGHFVGHLTVVGFTVGDADQLRLTGVLNGAVIHRTGAKTQVKQQTFTAPAALIDADRTTDVLLLKLAPISLAPVGWQLTLAQITLDIDAVPNEGDALTTLVHAK
jgi:hypothetical protein